MPYRVSINWSVEEISNDPDVEVIDAEIISDTVIQPPDVSDIYYYDALARNLAGEKPLRVRRSADFEEFVSSDKHINLLPVFLTVVFIVAGVLSVFLWFVGG